MTKTIEKAVENYVVSVPLAMWKTKRDLMQRKNFQENYAIEQAVNYGKNMLNAGVGKEITPQNAVIIFRELATINTTMADWCENQP